MPRRLLQNLHGQSRTPAGKTAPGSLHAELRKAFREWLDASTECEAFERDALEAMGNPTAERRLTELRQRVDAKAEAFDEARRRCSSSSLYVATLYAAMSAYK